MISWKCPDCGTWWSGLEHRCPTTVDSTGTFVIRPYTPFPDSGSTSNAPWCGICQGWHVPGTGACMKTYSWPAGNS